METIEKIQELIMPILEECHVRLYECSWEDEKEDILQVSIMKEDGSMDLDTCAEVSEKISEVLDNSDVIKGAYTLEVCSPGAEREIKDLNELNDLPQPYVYVQLKNPFKNMNELTGTVLSYENQVITMEYRDKAATRKAQFPAEDVTFIRLAVKF